MFRDCIPSAHTLVRLRINRMVTNTAARLTTELPGSALFGPDSHQLDDSLNFKVASPASYPSRPALPGRNTTISHCLPDLLTTINAVPLIASVLKSIVNLTLVIELKIKNIKSSKHISLKINLAG